MALGLSPDQRSTPSFLGCGQAADDRLTQPGSCQFSTATTLNGHTETMTKSTACPVHTIYSSTASTITHTRKLPSCAALFLLNFEVFPQ